MSPAKRRVTLTLDADLVEELKRANQSLSAQVNAALRIDREHRRRHRLLVEMLDRLAEEDGPVKEALVEKYVALLQ